MCSQCTAKLRAATVERILLGAKQAQKSESQAHGSAAAGRVRNVNCSAMSGGDLANECQSDAAALPLGREEGHKYLLALIERYAWTVVRDRDGHATVRIAVGGQSDSAGGRIAQRLDRVSHQIDEGLIKQFDIGRDLERFRRDTHRQMNVAGREVIGEQALESREDALHRRNLYLRHQVLG